jgi:GR25 family glycosyltransferase involved in LPS biosynthesis
MNTVNKFFDNVYCINLLKRADRLEYVQKELVKQGITAEIFTAIDGVTHSFSSVKTVDVNKKTNSLIGQSSISSAEAALIATHKLIFVDALSKGYKSILILEDDVAFSPYFLEKFDAAVSELPDNWEVFFLGALRYKSFPKPYSEHLEIPVDSLGAHALALRSSVFEKLLNLSTFTKPIDVTYADELHNLNAFLCKPSIINQKEGIFSDIKLHINQTLAFPF